MRETLLNWLRCPVDLCKLKIEAEEVGQDEHIIQGKLLCAQCKQYYSIEEGVPHLVLPGSLRIDGEDLSNLQLQTVDRFGFEWRYFRDWGWLAEYPPVPEAEVKFYGGLTEHTEEAFWSKSLFSEEDLHEGLLVLDAGCGNGRFTDQVARTGAEVIGIDLGWGVLSAFEHTRSAPNVHIVRGDIFRLPFPEAIFDRIFSIGVLHHTGNAGAAFDALARALRPNGLIVAHVYGKGLWTYELLDALIRGRTTRLSIQSQIRFAEWTSALARWFCRGGRVRKALYWRLFQHLNLLPTVIHMYDWWSAPIATHHTREEVIGWFERNGLEVLRTNPPQGDRIAEVRRKRGHAATTVLGRCPTGD